MRSVSFYLFTLFALIGSTGVCLGASEDVNAERALREQLLTIACDCFAETYDTRVAAHFGDVYGRGVDYQSAYQAAEVACSQKPAVLNEGGALWWTLRACVVSQ